MSTSTIFGVCQSTKYECTPNPRKSIAGFRDTAGYNLYTVIADLVDNSIDAESTKIKISYRQKNRIPQVVIVDNGYGMSRETLIEALRIGSDLNKDLSSDLGKYGLALPIAPITLGKSLTILTKLKESIWIKGVLDVDEIIKENKWEISVTDLLSESDEKIVKEFAEDYDSGTILIIDKLDRKSSFANTTQNSDIIKKEIRRIFWKKLSQGLKLFVNGKEIEPYDPLEWENHVLNGTDRFKFSEIIEGPFKDQNGNLTVNGCIEYKVILLPKDTETEGSREWSRSMKHSGFYVYRNNREIAYGETLGMFTKHNAFNRFRGSISFNADELDDAMGTTFVKSNFDCENVFQSVLDKLVDKLNPHKKYVAKIEKQDTQKEKDPKISKEHEKTSKKIKRNKNALILPEGKKEKRKYPGGHSKSSKNTETRSRGTGTSTQPGKLSETIWRTQELGRSGSIYEVDKEVINNKEAMVITWNSQHPLYEIGCENTITMGILDKIIHSMSVSELDFRYNRELEREYKSSESTPEDLILKFKNILSTNLTILLS